MAAAMIPLYVILTIARSHDVAYLNGIFEMKNSKMPIFITQPYMYIANNYDNFNCLVEQLPSHTFGLRMLFPVWALTGLKFLYPSLVSFPLYVTKEELTTVTLLYDAYYDFGLIGVIAFAALLGGACGYLSRQFNRMQNPAGFFSVCSDGYVYGSVIFHHLVLESDYLVLFGGNRGSLAALRSRQPKMKRRM